MLKPLLIFICLCIAWPGIASAKLTEQQQWFQDAREALKSNKLDTFNTLYTKLEHYPLHPYLDIWRYWNALDKAENDARVERILSVHQDIPESIDLRKRWIQALMKRGQWTLASDQLKKLPKGKHSDQRINLLSKWHNGQKKLAVKDFTAYWRKISHTDARLKEIEKKWKKQGHPTSDDLWARVNIQVKRGRWSEAKKIATSLSASNQTWLKYWQQVRKQPERWLKSLPKKDISPAQMAKILDDGLRQLGKKDVILSWQLLQTIKPRLKSPHDGILKRHIGLRAAFQHKTEAIGWLRQLRPAMQNDTSRTWPARLLLLEQQWPEALAAIKALPSRIRNKESSRWLYWQARCLEAMNQQTKAKKIYRKLAKARGYYSFLSAERVNLQYHIGAETRPGNKQLTSRMKQVDGLQRAREWFYLGQVGKATREWSSAMRKRTAAEWYAAMQLAQSWRWDEKALRAASRAKAHNNLVVRFPMAFQHDVVAAALRNGLEPSVLWSVIRQESLFNPIAISHAGARGLMQLMPQTARQVAKHHPKLGKQPNLNDPATNITLGSWYLGSTRDRFNGKIPLAVAAYNAGPGRVAQWAKQTKFTQPDLWIEAIPFNETRNYVQRIMAYSIIYDWRQGNKSVLMSERMRGKVTRNK